MLGLHAQGYAGHTSEVSPIEGQKRWEGFYSLNLISWQFLGCIKFLKYPRPEKVLRQGVREAPRDIQVACSGLFRHVQRVWQVTQAFARAVLTGVPRNKVSGRKEVVSVNFKSKCVRVERSIFQNAVGEVASVPSMTGLQEHQWKPAVLVHCATLSYVV